MKSSNLTCYAGHHNVLRSQTSRVKIEMNPADVPSSFIVASLRLSEWRAKSGFELSRAEAGSQCSLWASAHAGKMACFHCWEFFSQLHCKFTKFFWIMQAFCQIFLRNFASFFALHFSFLIINYKLSIINLTFEIKVTIILAVWRQLVVLQTRQNLLQLEEEPFAWGVAIRVHVKISWELRV